MAPTIRPAKPTFPLLRNGQVLIGIFEAAGAPSKPSGKSPPKAVTSFSVELMPRTTRAQSMDVLSSMATICGYKAVVLAADYLAAHFFPCWTTAAGTITPGRVFVIGAGVAGFASHCHGLGRLGGGSFRLRTCAPAAKEQVHSLGGRFVELPIEGKKDARKMAPRLRAGRRMMKLSTTARREIVGQGP